VSDELLNQTRAGYDSVASAYARALPDTSFEAAIDLAMIDHFLAQIPEAGSVLDAGCGAGRMLCHLHDHASSLRLSGADLSPRMVAEAKRVAPFAELAEANLATLPFGDEEFDGVLGWYSIIHTPPHALSDIFVELRRVMRPGAVLLLGYQSGTGTRVLQRPYGEDARLTSFLHNSAYVSEALTELGFDIDTTLVRAPRQQERHSQAFVLASARG
jgi:ubiquinone/menaquinone biosynthesis C-methylase UbiE